jgi:enamine deaminase RidA (YjgF/YER057c/UK114 family)
LLIFATLISDSKHDRFCLRTRRASKGKSMSQAMFDHCALDRTIARRSARRELTSVVVGMIKRLAAGKRHSMVTIHGGLVYLAGQVPDDLSVGPEAQAAQVLAKMRC